MDHFSRSNATRASFYCYFCGPVLWRKADDPPSPDRHFWADTHWPSVTFFVGLAAVVVTALICYAK